VDSRPATIPAAAPIIVSVELKPFRKGEFAFMADPFRQRRETTSRRRLDAAQRKG
jgi:hypothetical protein